MRNFLKTPPILKKFSEKIKISLEKLSPKTPLLTAGKYKKIALPYLKSLPQTLKKAVQEFDPQKITQWTTAILQKRDIGFYGTLATLTLSTYFISDTTAIIAKKWIPEPTDSRLASRLSGFQNMSNKKPSLDTYSVIFSRNLFNSQGFIPGDESTSPQSTDNSVAVKSTIPMNLIGTLIMLDELRSIATIEDKTSSLVYPMSLDDELPGKIKITKVEPTRVIFINKTNGRKEFLELPNEPTGLTLNPKLTPGGPTIEKTGKNQFNVSRVEVDNALADFNAILTQARAVPNFENGAAAGYKLFQIVPGSIYEKLGLQNGDIINGLNGQTINDPAKAFEMLSELKTASHLELQVKKDGKQSTYIYEIR